MPLTTDHYINLKNGAFDSTSKGDLDHLFTSFSNDPKQPPLVVHFHGGLVGERAGMAVASNLLPVYESAGGYPVFFVWESGLLDVLKNNLQEILNEKILQLLLKKVTQFAVAKLKQTADTRGLYLELDGESDVDRELSLLQAGTIPYSDLEQRKLPPGEQLRANEEKQFKERLDQFQALRNEAAKVANSLRAIEDINADRDATRGLRVQGSTHTWMSPELLEEMRLEETATGGERGLISSTFMVKHAISVLKNFIARWAGGRHHGVYATVFEETLREFYVAHAGQAVWSQMKKDTEDAFQNDPQRFGGTAFLDGINKLWLNGSHPRIILIGHSTGAVYICNLLKFAEQKLPPDVKFDVVFLAPACTYDLLTATLKTCAQRVNGIRSFALQDTLEKADHVVPGLPFLYPHSLLYFVSGVVEDEADKPIVGMQRFYQDATVYDAARFPDVQFSRSLLAAKPERTVWAIESLGDGRESRSSRHTDFDEDADTLKSLRHIISQGL